MPLVSKIGWIILSLALAGCGITTSPDAMLPQGFVYLANQVPGAQQDIRYYTSNNFVGRPIVGYFAGSCILTAEAASALAEAQQNAESMGYSLKVYDCYRPQSAVNDFTAWAADVEDILVKHRFYPQVDKSELFTLGYIAEQSGHSRGSTVDITLVPLGSQQPDVDPFSNRYDCRSAMPRRYPDNSLDMGSGYDCFDEISHTGNPDISNTARRNRQLLQSIMEAAGFVNYDREWWHYTLDQEPHTDVYFDFPVN